MKRKRDWRWVTLGPNDSNVADIWNGRDKPTLHRNELFFQSNGTTHINVCVCVKELAKLGINIKPGEVKKVRITLEEIKDVDK